MKENLNDLHTFMVVAQERSFTRAAAKLRTSQSAISQTLRNLEDRIGIKLLSRTTRSVAPTEAGEYLLNLLQPAIEEIENGINQISALKNDPAGTLRISADEYGIQSVLWPAVEKVIQQFPKISVEIISDYGLVDIVEGRFDAGLRRGGLVSKDMIKNDCRICHSEHRLICLHYHLAIHKPHTSSLSFRHTPLHLSEAYH
ncbi:LysR family transcriptional regulator [Acinetobacter baumannii]|uniref:LysR family transcriptional regulator n=1 Tax=Acinetobacter baumannii TaxID=470 RepID=UPI0031F2FC9B